MACRLRNEESVDRRDVGWVGDTAQRNTQAEGLRVTGNRQGGAVLTLPGVSHHGGSGGAGADRVHANTVRGKLQTETGTHARRRRLRCTVGAKLRAGHTRRIGGDRHQGPAVRRVAFLLVNHDAPEFAQAQEHAVGVDRVQALPGVEAGFQERLAVGDARGEHRAGDGFLERRHSVGEGGDGLFARDVYGAVAEDSVPVGTEGGNGLLRKVCRKYRITVLNELVDGCLTNTAIRTGHNHPAHARASSAVSALSAVCRSASTSAVFSTRVQRPEAYSHAMRCSSSEKSASASATING